jgi:hypothetical protein
MALSDDGSLLGLRSELLVDIKLARLMFGAQKELIVRDEVQFDPKISAMRPHHGSTVQAILLVVP